MHPRRWPILLGAGLLFGASLSAQEPQLRQTLTRHTGYVTSLALSPDGKVLASAEAATGKNPDRSIKLWDVTSGMNTATFAGNIGAVYSVAFSPDGKSLASGNADRTIKLWDIKSGQNTSTFLGHQASVKSVAFHPDGKVLASAGGDQTVKLWDVASGRNIATLDGARSKPVYPLFSMVISLEGKLLACANSDGSIKLWDVATRNPSATLRGGHVHGVWSVAFSPDGNTLASGGSQYPGRGPLPKGQVREDGKIQLWNVDAGRVAASLEGHKGSVACLAFSPDGKTLVFRQALVFG